MKTQYLDKKNDWHSVKHEDKILEKTIWQSLMYGDVTLKNYQRKHTAYTETQPYQHKNKT